MGAGELLAADLNSSCTNGSDSRMSSKGSGRKLREQGMREQQQQKGVEGG